MRPTFSSSACETTSKSKSSGILRFVHTNTYRWFARLIRVSAILPLLFVLSHVVAPFVPPSVCYLLSPPIVEIAGVLILAHAQVSAFKGNQEKLTSVALKNTQTGEESELTVDAAFIAIGHTPNTELFKNHLGLSSSTSVSFSHAVHLLKPFPEPLRLLQCLHTQTRAHEFVWMSCRHGSDRVPAHSSRQHPHHRRGRLRGG